MILILLERAIRSARESPLLALALLVSMVGSLGSASAASAAAFSLANPITLDGTEPGNAGVLGTIHPVADVSGTFAADPGLASFAGHDVLVIDLALDPGSRPVDRIQIAVGTAAFGFDLVHAGVFTSVGGSGGTTPPDGFSVDNSFEFVGTFDYAPDSLSAGEASVRLFVVYTTEGTMLENQTATIRIGSGTTFMVQGLVTAAP